MLKKIALGLIDAEESCHITDSKLNPASCIEQAYHSVRVESGLLPDELAELRGIAIEAGWQMQRFLSSHDVTESELKKIFVEIFIAFEECSDSWVSSNEALEKSCQEQALLKKCNYYNLVPADCRQVVAIGIDNNWSDQYTRVVVKKNEKRND